MRIHQPAAGETLNSGISDAKDASKPVAAAIKLRFAIELITVEECLARLWLVDESSLWPVKEHA